MSNLTRSSSVKRSADFTDATARASKRPRNVGQGFETERRNHELAGKSKVALQVVQLEKTFGIYSKPVAALRAFSASDKRTSNKIAIPRPGDTKGPAQYTPPSTRSRSASVVLGDEGLESDDDMKLSSSLKARHSKAMVSHKALTMPGMHKHTQKLPQKTRSSRTRGHISALMSGADGATRTDLKDESPSKTDVSIKEKPDVPAALMHATIQDFPADTNDDDLGDSDNEFKYDVIAAPANVPSPRIPQAPQSKKMPLTLPSPAPSDQSQSAAPRAFVAHSPSNSKRYSGPALARKTPTKAVKPNMISVADISSALHLDAVQLPTPTSTPAHDAPPAVNLPYSSQEVGKLLHTVLRQLASPCHSLRASAPTPALGDPHWLAQHPCLSTSHDVAEKDVRNTLDRTIRAGEGNCMLLVGERGIGKTAIIERSLQLLRSVHGEDSMLVIRLSGLVHRDDKAALREIAKKLSSSAYVEEDEDTGPSSFNSNASVLSSLLAILEPGQSGSADALADLARPLVFIIDEFDTFAHHSVRQSFLYCLLDCVQGGFRRGGMAIIGVSARADCIETLEKRVKSRCQSRVHHVLAADSPFTGTAKTVERTMLIQPSDSALSSIEQAWNTAVKTFFASKTTQAQLSSMNELRGFGAEYRLLDVMIASVARLLHDITQVTDRAAAASACLKIPQDALIHSLQASERLIPLNLSIAECALLISAKHIVEEEKPLNFAIIYDRYVDHAKRATVSGASSARPFSRAVCLRAFQRLRALRIFADISGGMKAAPNSGSSSFRMMRLIPWPHMIDEAVKTRKEIPQDLVKWSKNWSE